MLLGIKMHLIDAKMKNSVTQLLIQHRNLGSSSFAETLAEKW